MPTPRDNSTQGAKAKQPRRCQTAPCIEFGDSRRRWESAYGVLLRTHTWHSPCFSFDRAMRVVREAFRLDSYPVTRSRASPLGGTPLTSDAPPLGSTNFLEGVSRPVAWKLRCAHRSLYLECSSASLLTPVYAFGRCQEAGNPLEHRERRDP